MNRKIPFGGWFGTNRGGRIIAVCFRDVLSEKQLNYLHKWWRNLIPHPQNRRWNTGVIIDGETIEEIAQIVENAFKEAGREDELEALCNFVLGHIPPNHIPEHRNLTDKPCPICEVAPNTNHKVGCPSYGLWHPLEDEN